MAGIRVSADGDEVLRSLKNALRVSKKDMYRASSLAEAALKKRVLQVFKQAIAAAGSGFPAIYAAHLLDTVSNLPIEVEIEDEYFSVAFDIEELGSYSDFEEGFHYEAAIKSGGHVELPYGGEDLRFPLEKRYAYWSTKLPASFKKDTYIARVDYWDSIGVAPQWLLLNYGQTQYEPYVNAYPIVENIEALTSLDFESIMESVATHTVEAFNYGSNAPQGNYYNVRDSRGRFTRK